MGEPIPHEEIWREMLQEMNARRCDASSLESENHFRRMETFCRLVAEKYAAQPAAQPKED